MANPWFRMYSEFSHDPKVQMMPEAMQRRYIMIMCLRCSNDLVTLHETEIAFHLRISAAELAETKALFLDKGFIDEHWNLLNWEKRQFASDSSAARVSKHRERKKQAGNVDVTLQKRKSNALDTDTDTDTDKNKEKTMSGKPDDTRDQALGILDYLNLKAGREFRPVEANVNIIVARMREGATMADCKQVIDRKVAEWKGGEFEQYLAPDTLFRASKFAKYIGQLAAPLPAKSKPGQQQEFSTVEYGPSGDLP